jgi:Ala-tRNA(Pro) deacylase
MKQYIKDFLNEIKIKYEIHEHETLHTSEQATHLDKELDCITSKNLFLKSKKGDKYYLVILPVQRKLDLKLTQEDLNEKKLRFCNKEELRAILGLEPGSVSILGLINDKEDKVKLFIDKEIWEANKVSCHPNDNTMSLVLSGQDYQKIAKKLKPSLTVI